MLFVKAYKITKKTQHICLMKTISILIFLLSMFFTSIHSKAQVSDSLNLDNMTPIDSVLKNLPEVFARDNNLKLIAHFLPANWKVIHNEDSLIFQFPQPIYEMPDDLISDAQKRQKSRFSEIKDPIPEECYIVFLMDSLWAGSKVDEVKAKNSFLNSQIEKLGDRFKITHLTDTINSEGFDIETYPLTENERKSVVRYFEEKEKLEKDIIRTPDFHTTYYSFYLDSFTPSREKFHRYTPPYAFEQLELILELFQKHAGK
jgi:hypothetical protein